MTTITIERKKQLNGRTDGSDFRRRACPHCGQRNLILNRFRAIYREEPRVQCLSCSRQFNF